MPPLESQIASSTKPPPAVATQAISAAHSMLSASFRPIPSLPAAGALKRNPTCPRLRFVRTLGHSAALSTGGGGPRPPPPPPRGARGQPTRGGPGGKGVSPGNE